jgi:hypothetical protein
MVCELKDPNKKGTFGQIAVLKDLTAKGYDVFGEVGKSSKVDFIVLDENYKTFKVQVKTCNLYNGKAILHLIKKCLDSKYNSRYTEEQVDIFALYVIEKDTVIYISAKEALNKSKSTITFSFGESKNNQKKGINLAEDYYDINKFLMSCKHCGDVIDS